MTSSLPLPSLLSLTNYPIPINLKVSKTVSNGIKHSPSFPFASPNPLPMPSFLLLLLLVSLLPLPSTAPCQPPSAPTMRGLLTKEDFHYHVKFLPSNQQVSTFLLEGQAKRLVFPLPIPAPLTITVTPCAAPLSWILSLRSPHPPNTTSAREGGVEVVEETYQGFEPKLIERERADPGLYILQVETLGGGTHVHVQAECEWSPAPPPPGTITATPTPHTRGRAVTLSWSKSGGSGYCLAASESGPFPSLCAARAAQAASPSSDVNNNNNNSGVMLGCTSEPHYQLPYMSPRPLHVTVWAAGRPGPPLVTGVVLGRRRNRMARLRPGRLVRLVVPPTGTVMARYRVRRPTRRLHVVAVACGGARLRVRVTAPGGQRVATAAGSLGAIYLSIKDSPPKTVLLHVRTTPPGAANHILLTAAHTARALPLPRPPRKARVRVRGVNCRGATIQWSAAPGPYQYCLLLNQDQAPSSRRTRPARQCGWESALRHKAAPGTRSCTGPVKGGRKRHKLTTLDPDTPYTVTVLARHPVTRYTLSLTPVSFSTLSCPPPPSL